MAKADTPPAAQVPKALSRFVSASGDVNHPVFSFAITDRVYDGRWSWDKLTGAAPKQLLDFMCEMSNLTWTQVKAQTSGSGRNTTKRHHSHPISELCGDAQQRLTRNAHDHIGDEMFRFRLSGAERLWGFVVDNIFYVVWWDPDHKVCPT